MTLNLILAAVPTGDMVGCCIASFLVGMAVMGVILVSHGNPRADQLAEELRQSNLNVTELTDRIEEMCETQSVARGRYAESLLKCGEQIASLETDIATKNSKIASLEETLKAWGIKPAAVQEKEHDYVGSGLGCCANGCTCGPIPECNNPNGHKAETKEEFRWPTQFATAVAEVMQTEDAQRRFVRWQSDT